MVLNFLAKVTGHPFSELCRSRLFRADLFPDSSAAAERRKHGFTFGKHHGMFKDADREIGQSAETPMATERIKRERTRGARCGKSGPLLLAALAAVGGTAVAAEPETEAVYPGDPLEPDRAVA